ncbi:MAG: hypothetical protein HY321_08030 [Armatimonadetes bacterium]|nr:hypothetical protein [Armatimonadota bacterium]
MRTYTNWGRGAARTAGGLWGRRAAACLGLLAAALGLAGPARGQATSAVEFFTDPGLTQAWSRVDTDNSTTPPTPIPLVEWGETVWIRATHPNFQFPQAGPPPVTPDPPDLRFQRVDPSVAAIPGAVAPTAFGFQLRAAAHTAGETFYRVGVDMGVRLDNGNWQVGVPQRSRTDNGTPPQTHQSEQAYAGSESIKALNEDSAGTPVALNVQPNRLVLTPGEWIVWAKQGADSTTPLRIRILHPLTVMQYDPYNVRPPFNTNPPPLADDIRRFSTPWPDDAAGGALYNDPESNDANGNPTWTPLDPALGAPVAGRRVLYGNLSVYLPADPLRVTALSLGEVEHGRISPPFLFGIADRSRLAQVPNLPPSVRVGARMAHGNMNPAINPLQTAPVEVPFQPPTNWVLPDPLTPGSLIPGFFDMVEYPPILKDRLGFQKYGTGENPETPAQSIGSLLQLRTPPPAAGAPPDRVNPDLFMAQVNVLRYQPDTIYATGWLAAHRNNVPTFDVTVPESDPVKVWVDVDGNGRLNRVGFQADLDGDLNPEQYVFNEDGRNPARATPWYPRDGSGLSCSPLAAYEVLSDYAEPYREFNLMVRVPTDLQLAVSQALLDLGKHPHNTVRSGGPTDLPAVRPFTVVNNGNVNLLNLRVAHEYQVQGEAARRPVNLYAPNVESDPQRRAPDWELKGIRIPPTENVSGNVRKHILWSFDDPVAADEPAQWEEIPGGPFIAGRLLKARAGALLPTSAAGREDPNPNFAGQLRGPRLGVISPFGAPVGTYANQFVVYEDMPLGGSYDKVLDCIPATPGQPGFDYRPLEPVSQSAFTVKLTVTDRQLTEEPGGYGIDRPLVGRRNGNNPRADTFLRWPGRGSQRVPAQDSQPTAVRFADASRARHLAVIWSSNRPDQAGRSPQPPGNDGQQSWYLYGSRTVEDTQYWPFWLGYNVTAPDLTAQPAPNPPEFRLPENTSLFGGFLGALGGATLVAERYVTPSVAQSMAWDNNRAGRVPDSSLPSYLFFQGIAHASVGAGTRQLSRLYSLPLDANLLPSGNPVAIGPEQSTLVKHGLRGLSYRAISDNRRTLWAFWYGGVENQWQAFFSKNDQDPSRETAWSDEQRLPIFGDFTSIQDPHPMLWTGTYTTPLRGTPDLSARDMVDVLFAGVSKYRRNSDIYMVRLDPNLLGGGRRSYFAKQAFAPVRQEVLDNSKNRVYYSDHLEWVTRPNSYSVGNQAIPVFPRIYRKQPGQNPQALTPDPTDAQAMRAWVFNMRDYSYTCRFSFPSTAHTENTDLTDSDPFSEVTIYPLAGTVHFSKPMDSGDVILADYVPSVLCVAGSPQMEGSPCAFVDTRLGPSQSPTGAVQDPATGRYYFPRTYAPRHRLWVFYTRIAPQVSNPTVWHKTMRLMVKLPVTINASQGNIVVRDEFGRSITQFTIDQDRGILFFPTYQTANPQMSLEGRKIEVDVNGTTLQDLYIRWQTETPDAPLPIEQVVNEGKVWAMPDIPDPQVDQAFRQAVAANPSNPNAAALSAYLNDPGSWRVWLFWSSARPKALAYDLNSGDAAEHAYDTDLRYMTIAPRLDFVPTIPPQ